mgnify:FL=1
MSITLKDIAKAAGVHQTVVSVVLNNRKYTRVSPERREYIRRIAEEMGYRPNLQAASLRQRKKATVGVFLPPWRDVLLLEQIKGLADGSNRYDIPLTYYFGMTADSYCSFIDSMTSFHHTGIISYVPFWDREYEKILSKLEEYMASGGKIISLNTLKWPMKKTITLDIDDEAGGRIAADHLLEKNPASYAVFTSETLTHDLREAAFCGRIREKKSSADLSVFHIAENELKREFILSEINRMLDQVKRPAGIMTVCTEFTGLILTSCEKRGWKYGADFELVGYDFAPRYGDYIQVPRVVQPFREMGSLAMDKLYHLLLGDEVQSEILKPILQEGGEEV